MKIALLLAALAAPTSAVVLVDYGPSYNFDRDAGPYVPTCMAVAIARQYGRPTPPPPAQWSEAQRRRGAELCTMMLLGGMLRDELLKAELNKGAKAI